MHAKNVAYFNLNKAIILYSQKIKSVIFADCFFKPIGQSLPTDRFFLPYSIKNTLSVLFCVIIHTVRVKLRLSIRRVQIFTVISKEFFIIFDTYQQRLTIPKLISFSDKFFYLPIISAILKFKIGSPYPFRTT